LHLPVFAFYF
jgi:hypothetical protein